jgi:hypothetical protein
MRIRIRILNISLYGTEWWEYGYGLCCTERRAAIGYQYLDIVLVRQWEKSHEICSFLQPTVVQKEEKVSTSLQPHILQNTWKRGFKKL